MSATGQPAVTPERIMQMAWGHAAPLLLEAAIRNGIFDTLDGGAKTVEEVAAATGASARGLRIAMNALTGLQFLAKDAAGNYSLSPDTAAFLVKGKPAYLGGMLSRASEMIPRWLNLADTVRTGKPGDSVNQEGTGTEFFQKLVVDLFPVNYRPAQALADALNLSAAQAPVRVLDLAAGSGVWGIALAQRSPQVTVTAVDWAGVLPATRQMTERFGLAGRFSFVAGDLAAADFGTGHNVATLGHILHSEGPERSRALLRKTFDALAPGGTIAIAEFLVNDERTGPPNGLIFAVNMLVATEHGDTYSFHEISGWLRDAGFADAHTVESPGPSPLILATRPA